MSSATATNGPLEVAGGGGLVQEENSTKKEGVEEKNDMMNNHDDEAPKTTTNVAANAANTADTTTQQQPLVDITETFKEAVQALSLGELLHDPNFTLFEAMSAIEMMDPKMDAGMLPNSNSPSSSHSPQNHHQNYSHHHHQITTFDDAVRLNLLPLTSIPASTLISITDHSLSALITWIEGHSLAQTLFTNLYLHRPTAIEDKALRAVVVALLKIVDVVEEVVSKSSTFEEEDFQPSLYGYNLATSFTDSKCCSMLRDCEEELIKGRIRRKKKGKGKNKNSKGDGNPPQENGVVNVVDNNEEGGGEEESSISEEEEDAVLVRLKFLRNFYSLLITMYKKEDVSEAPSLVSVCFECLNGMKKRKKKGKGGSGGEVEEEEEEETHTTITGFIPTINQRLLPPTFPRTTKIKSTVDSFQFLGELLARIRTVLKITSISSSSNNSSSSSSSFNTVLGFFHSFSESRPDILSRSLLQILYLGPKRRNEAAMIESMIVDVKMFMRPVVLSAGVRGGGGKGGSSNKEGSGVKQYREITSCVDMFFERTATVFSSLLIALGHNRARQRERLAIIFEDFANLQSETEKIDTYLHTLTLHQSLQPPHQNVFSNWLLSHICRLMIRYVYSGFELELYSVHEYCYVFWYLHEFLYAWLLSSHSRADNYLLEVEAAAASAANVSSSLTDVHNNSSSSSRKNKGGASGGFGGQTGRNNKKLRNQEFLLLQAEQNLCGGFFKTLFGLINAGRVPFPTTKYNNEETRYNHRFQPFALVQTPPLVQYSQYKQISDMAAAQPAVNLYLAGSKSFEGARVILEKLVGEGGGGVGGLLRVVAAGQGGQGGGGQEDKSSSSSVLPDLLKIAKTNFVVSKLLASGHTEGSKEPVQFDFSLSAKFPLFKVK